MASCGREAYYLVNFSPAPKPISTVAPIAHFSRVLC